MATDSLFYQGVARITAVFLDQEREYWSALEQDPENPRLGLSGLERIQHQLLDLFHILHPVHGKPPLGTTTQRSHFQ